MFWKSKSLYDNNDKNVEIGSYFSILIHFTSCRPYVYILRNGLCMSDEGGVFSMTDSDGEEIEITGNCVCRNDFETLEAAEAFIQLYQLDDPIRIEVNNWL
ncbi:hypothetical protein [Lederbergia lenta]|uniref:Uncharacterized protein n=1 Tax=Lederbergia lenta TaxID=1467 RepID=A0A2X4W524_LEDLE|nr:hypothetical protein [Lederbergia lenta]MCM3109463.1 hypothetical protein [Lederbergia lenta]MEC2324772.1 hypothetical protein [Lederbergia lenta]SQI57819.1 Uncharacterised protein [Lederbergia lenta]